MCWSTAKVCFLPSAQFPAGAWGRRAGLCDHCTVRWDRVHGPSCGDLSGLSGSRLYPRDPPGQEFYQLTTLGATRSSSLVSLGRGELGGVGWFGGRAICGDVHREAPTDELRYWGQKLVCGVSAYLLRFPGDLQQTEKPRGPSFVRDGV